ncbi:MAG TPA: RluA family pseudouridine synthase [Microbacteriaceae bacterium]|nr:RluA family pseudouridine synthase [Microbacteriaceae bacterium]
MLENRTVIVPEGLDGTRIDQALSKLFGFSRTFAQDIILGGGARLHGEKAQKSDRVQTGDLLEVEWAPKQEPKIVPVDLPELNVVYDDQDLIVVDKPAGVAAHPSLGWSGPTVLGALAGAGYKIATSGPPERQGVVQRLDVGTSGLMVVAKSENSYSVLKKAFKQRTVEKTYHTVVQGYPDPLSGTIEGPIARHPGHEWKFAVVDGGKHSVTHYKTLEVFMSASLLEIKLETGRTHQIRVHMAAHGHPLVGDPMYGSDPQVAERLGLDRQWLHAVKLAFTHPGTAKRVEFESKYPADLKRALQILRL